MLIVSRLIIYLLQSKVIKENLLIIKDLGIQSCYFTFGGDKCKKFHDISRVRDFIINDHVTFYYVR